MKKLLILSLAAALFAGCARVDLQREQLAVGTYNIRLQVGDNGTPNAWNERRADLVQLIGRLDLDILGLQEVMPGQAAYITNSLAQYALYGEYRNADRVSGEASPVCYRKDRLEFVDGGTFWLSETPEAPGVKGWDAACPRVCTWALLRDLRSGAFVAFVNTHTDHRGAKARKEGILLVLRRMRELTPPGVPIVFTGDHNCLETDSPARAASEVLRSAICASKTPPAGPWRTFNGWVWSNDEFPASEAVAMDVEERNAMRNVDPAHDGRAAGTDTHPRKRYACGGARIDYIYVSDGVEVLDCTTHADARPGKKLYPSDHFPVSSNISWTFDAATGKMPQQAPAR